MQMNDQKRDAELYWTTEKQQMNRKQYVQPYSIAEPFRITFIGSFMSHLEHVRYILEQAWHQHKVHHFISDLLLL